MDRPFDVAQDRPFDVAQDKDKKLGLEYNGRFITLVHQGTSAAILPDFLREEPPVCYRKIKTFEEGDGPGQGE